MHILTALRSLRPSGPKSFERLVADLLEELTERPFRLCRSGTQEGVDAVSGGIALQIKRYEDRSLSEAGLVSDLARAIDDHPDFDVWGLVSTTNLPAQYEQRLERIASAQGVCLLVLDAAAARPFLSRVSAVEALCAAAPPRVLAAVQDPEWVDSRKESTTVPPPKDLERELSDIRSQPRFEAWLSHIRNHLRGLPTWFRLRENLNRQLEDDIVNRSYITFGTEFCPDKLVHRSVTESLDDWLRQSVSLASKDLKALALVGERYDGKTWCVFDWILSNSNRFQLPLFFIPSTQGDRKDSIDDALGRQIQEALDVTDSRAGALLRRLANSQRGDGPWALVVLDGLNEYRLDPTAPERHLTSLLAERVNVNRRPALVLATAREAWWIDSSTSFRTKATRVSIGGFDDRELADALVLTGVGLADFRALAPSTQDLARRPRFFRLWAEHRGMLGEFASVTTDVLIYLDAFDKARSKSHLGRMGWDHAAFSNSLKELARAFRERSLRDMQLERGILGEILETLLPDWYPALRDLESEGVLRERAGSYEIAPYQLNLGMGLWISEQLRAANKGNEDLREALRDCLEPNSEVDEKVAWVRAAAMVELVEQAHERGRPAILAVLVDHWLRSRNLLPEDLEQLRAVSASVFPALLELAPRTWSQRVGNDRLQEISLICFAEAACRPAAHPDRRLLLEAVRRWLRTIPERGTRFVRGDDPEAIIRQRLAEAGGEHLGLVTEGEDGYLRLHRIALYLESLSRGLLRPHDVLCRVATEKIADSPLDDGEFFVTRRVLGNAAREWFWAQRAVAETERWARVLYRLVQIAERSDLQDLEAELKSSEDVEWEAWNRGMSTFERGEYLQAAQDPPAESESPLDFVRRSRFLVRDPNLPPPGNERLQAIRATIARELIDKPLQLHRSSTAHDHAFDDATTVLAAWMPELGVEIIQRQMQDLHRRFRARKERSETWLALSIGRHAVLARGRTRRSLTRVLSVVEQPEAFHAAQVWLALIPGMSVPRRLDMLLCHSYPDEWCFLYRVLASVCDQGLRRALLETMRSETNATRLKRRRLLAVELDIEIPTSERTRIERDLRARDDGQSFAALASAVHGRIDRLPPGRLVEIASQNDQQSLAPRYAAWMLVQQGEHLDELPAVWQAVAAERFPQRRESFLQQVEQALAGSLSVVGGQGAYPFDETVVEDVRIRTPCEGAPSHQHRFSVEPKPTDGVLFSSRPRGLGGFEKTEASGERVLELFDVDAATEKQNRLSHAAAMAAATHRLDLRTVWREEIFPQALVDSLPDARFERWCRLLIADPVRAGIWWGGVLQPLFVRALSEGRGIALQLWPLVAPFSRAPARPEVRFTCDGIDWVLHVLADPSVHDALATELLERVVLDCRSDLELFEIVLGARFRDPRRLARLVSCLLSSADVETRERAVPLAGWLGGFEETLKVASESDSSLGVRQMADAALQASAEESWAQHWLNVFLRGNSVEERWGAGQLFLACADRRVETWARERMKTAEGCRRRGEGHLLLEAAAASLEMSKRDRELRDRFLGFKVRELVDTCYPWQGKREWSSLHMR